MRSEPTASPHTPTPPRVVIVGLGPGDPGALTMATRAAIDAVPHRFLRTRVHPSAALVGAAADFDHCYEAGATFDDVYSAIVEALVAAAGEHGTVLYAVPGSPAVAERTVELLRADARVVTEVVPALSFADLTWARLGVDPLRDGAAVVDAHRCAEQFGIDARPLLVCQTHSADVLADVKLVLDADLQRRAAHGSDADAEGPFHVTVLHHLGLDDEQLLTIPWFELDRFRAADHLTSVWVPRRPRGAPAALAEAEAVVRELRDRCPWDREQTHLSLRRYVVEEAYELIAAVDRDEREASAGSVAHLVDELGDVLFQVLFHAVIGDEDARFGLADVADALVEKLRRRHPHVFPRDDFAVPDGVTADEVVANWEQIKRDEGSSSDPRAVDPSLPTLTYAAKVLKRIDAPSPDTSPASDATGTAVGELPTVTGALIDEAELGDALLALVRSARAAGLDADVALRAAVTRTLQP